MTIPKIIIKLSTLIILTLISLYAFAERDSVINDEISRIIATNKITDNSSVTVNANNGLVIISGNVQTETEAVLIIESAIAVNGVTDVDTEGLLIKNKSQQYQDFYITIKIKAILAREKLSADNLGVIQIINIETKKGVVYLVGAGDNEAQKQKTLKIIKNMKGVVDIMPMISITRSKIDSD